MNNQLIEASAGTGKTFTLVERMVRALKEGASPREIVALTFSRAAAGEIFARFVTRLAENAAKNAEDAALLRKVVDTQHLTLIGTLDSFLMRFVQMFPLELGLSGDISVLGDFNEGGERTGVSLSILRRSDEDTKRALATAFRKAMNREASRSFLETYSELIKGCIVYTWTTRTARVGATRRGSGTSPPRSFRRQSSRFAPVPMDLRPLLESEGRTLSSREFANSKGRSRRSRRFWRVTP